MVTKQTQQTPADIQTMGNLHVCGNMNVVLRVATQYLHSGEDRDTVINTAARSFVKKLINVMQ